MKHELTMNMKRSWSMMLLYIFFLLPTLFFFVAFFCHCSLFFSCVFLSAHPFTESHLTMPKNFVSGIFLNGIYIWYSTFVETRESYLHKRISCFQLVSLVKWNSTTQNDVIVGMLKLSLCQMLPIYTLLFFDAMSFGMWQ